jgi:hypothetical protein
MRIGVARGHARIRLQVLVHRRAVMGMRIRGNANRDGDTNRKSCHDPEHGQSFSCMSTGARDLAKSATMCALYSLLNAPSGVSIAVTKHVGEIVAASVIAARGQCGPRNVPIWPSPPCRSQDFRVTVAQANKSGAR